MRYVAPKFEQGAFSCPHCAAFAHQVWISPLHYETKKNHHEVKVELPFRVSRCEQCRNYAHWVNGKLVYPGILTAPPANADMPPEIKADFDEARNIVQASPRGAAALLRLCIQKICQHLGEQGEHLNKDIGNLVKKGLRVQIQQALDVVRVVGNNAVHPGQIDLKDDVATANSLFDLVNMIVTVMISEPKQVENLFKNLPTAQQHQIQKRDNPAAP